MLKCYFLSYARLRQNISAGYHNLSGWGRQNDIWSDSNQREAKHATAGEEKHRSCPPRWPSSSSPHCPWDSQLCRQAEAPHSLHTGSKGPEGEMKIVQWALFHLFPNYYNVCTWTNKEEEEEEVLNGSLLSFTGGWCHCRATAAAVCSHQGGQRLREGYFWRREKESQYSCTTSLEPWWEMKREKQPVKRFISVSELRHFFQQWNFPFIVSFSPKAKTHTLL